MSFAKLRHAVLACLPTIADGTVQRDRDGAFPFEPIARLRDAGILRLFLPAELNGFNASLNEGVDLIRSIGQADGPTALILTQHLAVSGTFTLHRDQPRIDRFLREKIACDRFVGLFAGTPERQERAPTVARRVEGGLTLHGRKGWTTGALIADFGIFPAQVVGEDRQISAIVPMSAPGLESQGDWDAFGMRSTQSHDLRLNGVNVPSDDIISDLPAKDAGPLPGSSNLTTGFFSFGAALFAGLYLGIADTAVAYTNRLLRERTTVTGRPLIDAPATLHALGEISLMHRAADAMLRWTAHEQRDPARWDSSTLPAIAAMKENVTRQAVRIVDRCCDAVGGVFYSRECPLERLYRDVRAGPLHPLNAIATLALLGGLAAAGEEGD